MGWANERDADAEGCVMHVPVQRESSCIVPLKHDGLGAHLLLDSCAKVMRQPTWNLRHSAE